MKEFIGKEGLWIEGDLTLVRIESIKIDDNHRLNIKVSVLQHAVRGDDELEYAENSEKMGEYFDLMAQDFSISHNRIDLRYVGTMLLSPESIELFKNREPSFIKIFEAQ